MTDRLCAHDDNPAIAICSGCGEDICSACHRTTLTGYALCTTCGEKIASVLRTRWESARTPGEILYAFAHTSVAVLAAARAFYGSIPAVGPALRPMVFGSVAYLIGAYAAFFWQWLFVDRFPEFIGEFASQVSISSESAFAVLLTVLPVVAPMVIGFHILMLHLALRLFGAPTHWRLSTRIVGYASAAYLFQIVPPIGEFPIGYMLSIVWLVNVEMVAVRRFFELGMWKSMAVVFIPFFALLLIGA